MAGVGQVDYDNLWQNAKNRSHPIRWRQLVSKAAPNSAPMIIFGYVCNNGKGPWFGYPKGESLRKVCCVHCGAIDIFHKEDWAHICPGVFQGVRLPCLEDHACRGQPSMSQGGCPMWLTKDWIEIG